MKYAVRVVATLALLIAVWATAYAASENGHMEFVMQIGAGDVIQLLALLALGIGFIYTIKNSAETVRLQSEHNAQAITKEGTARDNDMRQMREIVSLKLETLQTKMDAVAVDLKHYSDTDVAAHNQLSDMFVSLSNRMTAMDTRISGHDQQFHRVE